MSDFSVYEFLINQKIMLVVFNNLEEAQKIVADNFGGGELITLKSIYQNLEHYKKLNFNFPKYFKEKEIFTPDNCIITYHMN